MNLEDFPFHIIDKDDDMEVIIETVISYILKVHGPNHIIIEKIIEILITLDFINDKSNNLEYFNHSGTVRWGEADDDCGWECAIHIHDNGKNVWFERIMEQ